MLMIFFFYLIRMTIGRSSNKLSQPYLVSPSTIQVVTLPNTWLPWPLSIFPGRKIATKLPQMTNCLTRNPAGIELVISDFTAAFNVCKLQLEYVSAKCCHLPLRSCCQCYFNSQWQACHSQRCTCPLPHPQNFRPQRLTPRFTT